MTDNAPHEAELQHIHRCLQDILVAIDRGRARINLTDDPNHDTTWILDDLLYDLKNAIDRVVEYPDA